MSKKTPKLLGAATKTVGGEIPEDRKGHRIIPIYRAEANFIPISRVPPELVDAAEHKYLFHFYNEKACKRCPVLPDRHSETCDACEQFLGARQLSKVVTRPSGKSFLSVPIGGTKRMVNLLAEHGLTPRYVDKFSGHPVRKEIRVTRDLRDWQHEALAKCLERKRGIVVAPPRSGKTVLGVALTSSVKGKTIVIASQRDWLSQFHATFEGTATEAAFTDVKPRRIGFCKTYEDFEKYDVCLATFQQFMNKSGRRLLRKIKSLPVLLLIDECHGTSALETSRVLSQFSAEYLIGLTGTPNRKVTEEEIVFRLLIGPVIYRAKVEMLVPEIQLLHTGVTINLPGGLAARNKGTYARFVGKLEKEKTRLKVIAKHVAKAVKAGHSVMVPVGRVNSVKAYIDEINRFFPDNVCCEFTGGLRKPIREKNLADIRSGDKRVIVGNIALLSTGLNIPRLSMLIDRVTITSNIPKTIQRVSRVLTPMEGKKQPKLVIVVDDCDLQRATARNEFFNAIQPTFKPRISPEDLGTLVNWFGKNGSRKSAALEMDEVVAGEKMREHLKSRRRHQHQHQHPRQLTLMNSRSL